MAVSLSKDGTLILMLHYCPRIIFDSQIPIIVPTALPSAKPAHWQTLSFDFAILLTTKYERLAITKSVKTDHK